MSGNNPCVLDIKRELLIYCEYLTKNNFVKNFEHFPYLGSKQLNKHCDITPNLRSKSLIKILSLAQ
jgi:hypothetical protein